MADPPLLDAPLPPQFEELPEIVVKGDEPATPDEGDGRSDFGGRFGDWPTGQNEGQFSPGDRPDFVRVTPGRDMPDEVCTVEISGRVFEDWTTVWIEWEWLSWYSQFRVTLAEREPYPAQGSALQFKQGAPVDIFLGGIRVIKGNIVSRQVAYDANQHVIALQGVSATWYATRSSIINDKSNFENMTFLQIASEVLRPTGVKYQTLGAISQLPFKKNELPPPGGQIGDYLEKLARTRDILVSNTPYGDMLFIGAHSMPYRGADLVEGENIKKMQCLVEDLGVFSDYYTRGQSQTDDDHNGRDASEMEAYAPGTLSRYSALLTVIEHPVWTPEEVVLRNNHEVRFREGLTKIVANVTVYGWFRGARGVYSGIGTANPVGGAGKLTQSKNHALWMAGDEVVVHSPMALLDHAPLKIKKVTWTQSRQSGSETTMECVNREGLHGKGRALPRSSSNTAPPATPPAPSDLGL